MTSNSSLSSPGSTSGGVRRKPPIWFTHVAVHELGLFFALWMSLGLIESLLKVSESASIVEATAGQKSGD
jgi:hypothetical protein